MALMADMKLNEYKEFLDALVWDSPVPDPTITCVAEHDEIWYYVKGLNDEAPPSAETRASVEERWNVTWDDDLGGWHRYV